jgi:hypothetical protein
MSEPIQNVKTAIANIKDSTVVLILTILSLIICGIVIYYIIYYNNLKNNECISMNLEYGTLNGNITSIKPILQNFKYTLKDYYIKSAYNCCSGGEYKNDFVDTCVLKALLKQGTRGLDFEIFSIDDQPVVATSTSDSYYIKETFNYINFSDIMPIIRDYAFSGSTAPNPRDPIIIHLRIKSTNQAMYKNFAKILESYNSILLSKTYSFENHGENLGNVDLPLLMGKVIIIVDKINNSFLESPEFYEYVNMTSNSVFMRALQYYDIKYTPDLNELIEFNKLSMTIGMPDKGSNPQNPSSVVLREAGCQLLAMRYQLADINVEENDLFFNQNRTAFVLKPDRLRYIPITIPLPPPQDPAVSYATRTIESDFYKFNI